MHVPIYMHMHMHDVYVQGVYMLKLYAYILIIIYAFYFGTKKGQLDQSCRHGAPLHTLRLLIQMRRHLDDISATQLQNQVVIDDQTFFICSNVKS